MTVLTCEGEILVSDELPRALVTQSDLEQLCDMVTDTPATLCRKR